jgi:hypothetical protein
MGEGPLFNKCGALPCEYSLSTFQLQQYRHERPRAAAAQVAGRATQNRDCAPAQVVAATSTPTALTCNAGMRSWASAKDCGRMSAPAEATLRFASLREGPQVLAFYRVRSGFHCPDAPLVLPVPVPSGA